MGLFEVFLTGVGLSMDAFAVAICKGLNMKKINYRQAIIIGLFFGGFQALMPFIGWLIGTRFEQYIVSIDHWIAFILLSFIGGKMLYDTLSEKNDDCDTQSDNSKFDYKELLLMAIATSIDALAMGIMFALLGVGIWSAILIIGITTFILSIFGVCIGNKFGVLYKKKAEIAGGVVLIILGLKILLEHLGILNF